MAQAFGDAIVGILSIGGWTLVVWLVFFAHRHDREK